MTVEIVDLSKMVILDSSANVYQRVDLWEMSLTNEMEFVGSVPPCWGPKVPNIVGKS